MNEGAERGEAAARRLAELDCCLLTPGLTDAEFARIEREYGFEFAHDHRAFLAVALPVARPFDPATGDPAARRPPWPDWRDGDPEELRGKVAWPVEGVLQAVEHGWWDPAWGERPAPAAAAVAAAKRRAEAAPRMVPVFSHRYLPGGHGSSGRPVLSMMGADIIYYGTDLLDYLNQEFGGSGRASLAALTKQDAGPFWSDFL
ncbi:hypothetical protein [Amycolatopsis benzoatilytica]|uniref:hypothetical protein n=1 Tax=Amycolatopsis benzoatilytica TaxID=346045 RepID=UPI000370748F|nr:hypothetical protein [Amycolatopsis benzoatilytica]